MTSTEARSGDGVTIAIPNWNHEYLLPRSINSALAALRVLQASGVSGEVLVVDNASRDGSLALLRQLEALHYEDGLRVCAWKENGGICASRNHALQLASFRYVAFLDADNELIPPNLIHFYRTLRQTESAAAYGNLICLSGDVNKLLSNQSFQMHIFTTNYIDNCALFDRDQLLDIGGYMFNDVEDWELYLHLAALGRHIVYVPIAMGLYYDLPHSLLKDASARVRDINRRVQRIFNQLSIREHMPHNTRELRYHPDLGYL